jgi:hypothetical protein
MNSLRVLYILGIFTKRLAGILKNQVPFVIWRLESSRAKRVDVAQDVFF